MVSVKETHSGFSKTYTSLITTVLIISLTLCLPALGEPIDQQKLMEKSIGDSQRELAIAVRDYEQSLTKMEKARRDVGSLAKQVDSTKRQLEGAKNIYNRRLAAFYKAGSMSLVEYLFTSKSPYDFSTRMDMMMRISAQDLALINEIEALQVDLNNRLKILGAKYRSQQVYGSALRTKQNSIEAQLKIEQQRLDRVKEMGAIDGALMASLPTQRSMPSRDIDDPSARDAGNIRMIFPIAGAHAFQNTWGAPRSGGRHHQGTDIYASRGTPCVAVRDGIITTIDYHGLAGKYVRMTDADSNMYAYIHLDGYPDSLFPGKPVSQGEVIGYVGNTGNAAGGACHLHFEIHPGSGEPVNPYPYLTACDN